MKQKDETGRKETGLDVRPFDLPDPFSVSAPVRGFKLDMDRALPSNGAMPLPRILVTGFTPFGGRRSNPSAWVVRRLDASGIPGVRVVGAVVPTSYRGCERALTRLLRLHRPRAILSLGLASRRARLAIEMIALNVDHAEERDNARERRERRKIRPRGPWVLETRLPVDRLLDALRRERVPCGVSYHAGTYVCNHLFYTVLHRTRVPAGFVHLPPARRMKPRAMLAAVRVLLREIAKNGANPAAGNVY